MKIVIYRNDDDYFAEAREINTIEDIISLKEEFKSNIKLAENFFFKDTPKYCRNIFNNKITLEVAKVMSKSEYCLWICGTYDDEDD